MTDGKIESNKLNIFSPNDLQASEMQLIKSVLNSITQGVIICDAHLPDNPIIYTNAAFEKLTGYSFDETRGRNCRFLQGADTNQQIIDKIRESIGRKIPFHGKILNYRKNGAKFWNNLRIFPIFDQFGQLTHFLGILHDITSRKISEESLRASEARFRLLCESAPLGVFLANNQGQYLFSNRYLQTLSGLSFEKLLGNGWETIIHPEDRARVAQGWQEAAENGTERHQQYRFLPADGIVRWVDVRTAPVYSPGGQLISHVGTVEDITERKNSEESLRLAEAKYRNIVESLPAIVYLAEPSPPYAIIYVSPNIEMLGYPCEDWYKTPDMWVNLLHSEDRESVRRATETAMKQGGRTELEYRVVGKDGTVFWLNDKGRFISDGNGNRINWQGVLLDITATKELEEQLRQAQKLESVGLLAGGIAHDFNNMLTAINGYSDLTLRRLKQDDPLRLNIEEIKKAGRRSADLTHQLLAFSRQQVLKPLVLDLNEIITETIKMLQRLIGENIQLTTTLNPKVGRIKIDPGQLSQILMNLAVNARDAMPRGGKLIIETANIFIEPENARQKVGTLPGAYVLLTVSDNGTGMNAETRQKIFEPFFTTKEIGKGTGLGLATVYGIVKQSGGTIEVESRENIGTTFKIYLPRVGDSQQITERTNKNSYEMAKGSETILLVEDEEMVRNLSRQILETCGYNVVEACDGTEALTICEKGDCKFDLLMTDVVMPKMGGHELAKKLAERLPNLPILFTSGYSDSSLVNFGLVETNTNFIQKPFTPQTLSDKVREILDKISKS